MRWRAGWRRHNGKSGRNGRSCPKGRQWSKALSRSWSRNVMPLPKCNDGVTRRTGPVLQQTTSGRARLCNPFPLFLFTSGVPDVVELTQGTTRADGSDISFVACAFPARWPTLEKSCISRLQSVHVQRDGSRWS
jgi:hypothetical protein